MAHRKPLPRERKLEFSPDLLVLLIDDDEPRAMGKLKALRRIIRVTPELAKRYQLAPPPRRGRRPGQSGSKFEAKALAVALVVDLLGLEIAEAIRAFGHDTDSDSDKFKKMSRYLRVGRPALAQACSTDPEVRAMIVAGLRVIAEEAQCWEKGSLGGLGAVLFDTPTPRRKKSTLEALRPRSSSVR
jgi:hypothetical protein